MVFWTSTADCVLILFFFNKSTMIEDSFIYLFFDQNWMVQV